MMVMVMLIVAAIVAMKMMPDEQTQVTRENEAFYNSDLSQLREAIDLVRRASKDPRPENPAYELNPGGWKDFCASDTPVSISEKIASLTQWGFLRKSDIRDNSVPGFLWGTDTAALQKYWVVSINYASNTSFEISNEIATWPDNWEYDSKTATASIIKENKITINSMAIDEYPYQNKLGDNTQGPNSIRMIRIDR